MIMKPVIYRDNEGYIRRSLIKDTDDESDAAIGMPAGPPDLRQLDWTEVRKEMNNALAKSGAFSWDDVQGSGLGIQAALAVMKRYLIALYREEHARTKSDK